MCTTQAFLLFVMKFIEAVRNTPVTKDEAYHFAALLRGRFQDDSSEAILAKTHELFEIMDVNHQHVVLVKRDDDCHELLLDVSISGIDSRVFLNVAVPFEKETVLAISMIRVDGERVGVMVRHIDADCQVTHMDSSILKDLQVADVANRVKTLLVKRKNDNSESLRFSQNTIDLISTFEFVIRNH